MSRWGKRKMKNLRETLEGNIEEQSGNAKTKVGFYLPPTPKKRSVLFPAYQVAQFI
jgi:hypothetical protein